MHHFDLELELSWHDVHVVLAIPVAKQLPSRQSMLHKALHPPVAFALAQLVRPRPGEWVLDPMVGKGGALIAAALSSGCGAAYVGLDAEHEQLAACAANLKHAGLDAVLLLHGDATVLPFADSSVDVILTDLPFGKKHARPLGLYARAIAEMRRVLRMGTGRAALLTTSKAGVHAAVADDPGWEPVYRTEVCLGGLKVWLHLLRRTRVG